jgi:hypothetical protein
VAVCPAKNKAEPSKRAINMVDLPGAAQPLPRGSGPTQNRPPTNAATPV